MASIYAMHHDAALWPDPESFIPERHLAEGAVGAATQPYAWLPFGALAPSKRILRFVMCKSSSAVAADVAGACIHAAACIMPCLCRGMARLNL